MNAVLFDTSVLVPYCVAAHPHRVRALAVVAESTQSSLECWIALHSLAETFAVLSAMPLNPRLAPDQALLLIEMEILPHFSIVSPSIDAYREAMADMARVGRSGGAVYDALIFQAARTIGASRLYTFNEKHFRPLLREGESLEIVCPALPNSR
ncbi:type II toxin-antitoxin system VapC family toxin [Candidatus Contendibacter odensensis]|uniref:Ribonuclease VapC n=1 Tax=Candidatus Contendobacter odensis Run_B_J11 TaxID=1400861 RepID=A0A7U7J601_9GAMM|nr:PIN domain-containing protein [Candidatus Contendobacter odensis]CDH47108.1 putative PilT protein domain protein [Candidatus Contendobacter odensis Run_B_J11]